MSEPEELIRFLPESSYSIERYIEKTWDSLTRSIQNSITALQDSKVGKSHENKLKLYVSDTEDKNKVEELLRSQLKTDDFESILVLQLEAFPKIDEQFQHGLLYLPNKYVVPGGKFNEMYNWDSYFISIGLLHHKKNELARCMVENHLYQVQYYNTVLNANRTYYLFRSQPPFLTSMVRDYFEITQDKKWLKSQIQICEKFHEYFTSTPKLIEGEEYENSLSRYFAFGEGPAPESVHSEIDKDGKNHYVRVAKFFEENGKEYNYGYDPSIFYDFEEHKLTKTFYKGDRSMRESGCDPSCRFGMFNAGVIFYAPVCLNSLLYKMERDIAQFYAIIGAEKSTINEWLIKAETRKKIIDKYMWDEKKGLYFDYNFQTKKKSDYEFATTFFPLWCGLANKQQAARIVKNLSLFERDGGIVTSLKTTGCQWDAPFGWAPYQYIAVEGLMKYGFREDALRIASKFLNLVVKEFKKTGNIVEKYNVCTNSSDVEKDIQFGYSENEIGFGWTNGVILHFLQLQKMTN